MAQMRYWNGSIWITLDAANADTATIAGNVSGIVALANGGTNATTASGALTNLGAASITSVTNTQAEIVASTGSGIISGGAVTQQSTANMTVQISAVVAHMPSGMPVNISAVSSLAINAADATNPRIDLIYLESTAGAITYLAGTAGTSPVAPTLPTGGLALATIAVATNQTTVTTDKITDAHQQKAVYQNSCKISVKDFGAKGDGISDDTLAIQAAINYAYANGNSVFVPSGEYLVSSTINVPVGVPIVGFEAPNGSWDNVYKATFIPAKANLTIFNVAVTTSSRGVKFKNIAITNSNSYANVIGIEVILPDPSYLLAYLDLENVWIDSCQYGVHFKGTGYCGFERIAFKSVQLTFNSIGFFVETTGSWFNVATYDKCDFSSNIIGGVEYISLASAQTHVFRDCIFEDNGIEGINTSCYAFNSSGNMQSLKFDNCYFENNCSNRPATGAEITNFSNSGTATPYGKYIGNLELIGTTMYPYTTDPSLVADIILGYTGSVNITNCIIAPAVRFITAENGQINITGNSFAAVTNTKTKSCQDNPIVTILNSNAQYLASLVDISIYGNGFSWVSGFFTNFLTGVYFYNTLTSYVNMQGQLDPTTPTMLYKYNNGNYGFTSLYVSSTGDDTYNTGVSSNSPFLTMDRVIDFINNSKETTFSIYITGTVYCAGALKSIYNKNITFNSLSSAILEPTQYNGQGFLYYSWHNCNLTYNGVSIILIATLTGSFNYNVFNMIDGNSSVSFNSLNFDTNNTGSVLFRITSLCNLLFSITGCGFGTYATMIQNLNAYSNVIGSVSGSWGINASYGVTAARPTYIAAGTQFYDTTISKPIWYSGTVWEDATGTTV